MEIKLIVVGKLKEKYLKEGISEYQKRLSTMIPVEIIELSDEKIPDRASKKVMEQIKNQEGKRSSYSEVWQTPCRKWMGWFLPRSQSIP